MNKHAFGVCLLAHLTLASTLGTAQSGVAEPRPSPQPARTMDQGIPRIGVALSAVPVYPSNGIIPVELRNHFVFRSTDSWDHIIAYPTDFKAERAAGGTSRVVKRLQSRRYVAPSLSCTVRRGESGLFEYHYRFGNGQRARQSISSFIVPIARYMAPDPLDQISQGDPKVLEAQNWTVIPYYDRPGSVSLQFHASTEAQRLSSGGGQRVVSLQSQLLPGLSRVYFQGPDIDASMTANLPSAVVEQLRPIRHFAFDSASAIAVVPKFPRELHRVAIAGEYEFEIVRLLRSIPTGEKESSYLMKMKEALAAFRAQFPPNMVLDEAPDTYPFTMPSIQPQSEIEIMVRDAVAAVFVHK